MATVIVNDDGRLATNTTKQLTQSQSVDHHVVVEGEPLGPFESN
jgi:hypothetical protein